MPRRTIASLVLVVAIGLAATAAADSASDEARKRFEAGTAAFNLGEFKIAIDEYKAAYKLRRDPVFLYNIAQSYRMASDFEQALFFYRSYLHSSPSAPNRGEVAERIRTLEEQRKKVGQPPNTPRTPDPPLTTGTAPPASTTPPQTQTTAATPTEPPPPPVTDSTPSRDTAPAPSGSPALRLAGLVGGGVGVVALAAGIALFVVGHNAAGDLVHAKPGTVFDPSAESRAHSMQPAGVALMITGGVLTVGGVTLFILGRRRGAIESSASAARDGGAL